MLIIGVNFVNFRAANDSLNIGIFYDSLTERVCLVRSSNGEGDISTTISTKSLDSSKSEISFSIHDKGNRIRTISLAPDMKIACIQHDDAVMEFLVLENGQAVANFQQACRFPGATIIGVHWLSDRQVALVAEAGCEFYAVNANRRTLKLIKQTAMPINWFNFYPPSNLFVCASGAQNSALNCLAFQNNNLCIIGKFDVDFGCSPAKPRLLERDTAIASIYGKVCILVFQFEPIHGFAAALAVYEFPTDDTQQLRLNCLLRLDLVGLVGLHVVDNLILVHHKNAQSTLVFDLKLGGETPICTTRMHCTQQLQAALCLDNSTSDLHDIIDDAFLYSAAWKMFQPDIIIDLRHELFTRVQLELVVAERALLQQREKDIDFLVNFLSNRRDGEHALLELLQRIILRKELSFARITQIFRQLLQGKKVPNIETADETSSSAKNASSKYSLHATPFAPLAISHNSLLRAVFEPLYQHAEVDNQWLASLMVEFFLILKQKHIKVQETYVSELLVKMLVEANMFDRLQQLLQYAVIEKSKFLAYELIALSEQCPALFSIGLDMLKRRRDWEQIVEVLTTRGHLPEALRLLLEKPLDRVPFHKALRRLLDRAWKSDDRQLMFTVFSHLHYSLGRKHLIEMLTNDDFERYLQEFQLLFDREEVEAASQRFRMARLSSLRGRRSLQVQQRTDSFTSTTAGEEEEEAEAGDGSSSGSRIEAAIGRDTEADSPANS